MQEQLMTRYNDLHDALLDLPAAWEVAANELANLKLAEAAAKQNLEAAELDMLQAHGGRSGLGKNENERNDAIASLKRTNVAYIAADKMLAAHKLDVTAQGIVVDRLEKQIAAVGHQSRLLAALLNYLGSAGVPVTMPTRKEVEQAQLADFGI